MKVAKADLVPTDANLLRRVRQLRRAGGGLRGVLRAGQRPAAPGHPPGPGGDAGRGAGPAAPGPGGAVHRGVRGDPQGRRDADGRRSRAASTRCRTSWPGEVVQVRRHGEQVVIVHVGPDGPVEVARHLVTTPGSPRVDDAHFPPAPPGALNREPKARTAAEAEFLAIGDGAGLWLAEAAAAGATRVRAKMAEAVQLAGLHGDRRGRPGAGAGRRGRPVRRGRPGRDPRPPGPAARRRAVPGRGGHTLAQGTAGWARPRRQAGRQAGDRRATPRTAVAHSARRTPRSIRQALVAACSWLLRPGRGRTAAPAYQAPGRSSPRGRRTAAAPLARVHYDACLAIDYLDFAHARQERAVTAAAPAPPPLDDGLEQLLRRMRLPHMRRIAPEVLATAKAQRWDPAEVLRALLAEEVAGRDRSVAGHPPRPGRVPHREDLRRLGRGRCPRSRPRPRPRCAPWNGSAGTRTWWSAARPAPARRSCSKPSARPPSKPASTSPGSPSSSSACWSAATAPTTPSPRPSARILRADLVVVDDIGLLPVGPDAAEGPLPPRRRRLRDGAASRSAPTCTRRASTSSCPRPWPPPPSTGSCTTPTSARPAATASASPKPSPGKG